MTFDEYQKLSRKTALYPKENHSNLIYPVLGLTGESGEVAEKIKKILRDKNWVIEPEDKESIAKELGDVLWYAAQIATELELSMSDIADKNINKLYSRLERGALGGSGDNR